MILLDTDVLSSLQHGEGEEVSILRNRVAHSTPNNLVYVCIINFEEQLRGWLDWIAKAKTIEHQVFRYRKLHGLLEDYKARLVLDFDQDSALRFQELKKQKIRIGTMDLKIAAIALTNRATLISRNLSDFREVPGLQVEDWTKTS